MELTHSLGAYTNYSTNGTLIYQMVKVHYDTDQLNGTTNAMGGGGRETHSNTSVVHMHNQRFSKHTLIKFLPTFYLKTSFVLEDTFGKFEKDP